MSRAEGHSSILISTVCDEQLIDLTVQAGETKTEIYEARVLLDEPHALIVLHKLIHALRRIRRCQQQR